MTQKRKVGRPSLNFVNKNIRLSSDHWEKVAKIGEGNHVAGVRTAIGGYSEKKLEYVDLDNPELIAKVLKRLAEKIGNSGKE